MYFNKNIKENFMSDEFANLIEIEETENSMLQLRQEVDFLMDVFCDSFATQNSDLLNETMDIMTKLIVEHQLQLELLDAKRAAKGSQQNYCKSEAVKHDENSVEKSISA